MTQHTFRKTIFLCFSDFSFLGSFFIYNFLKKVSKKCCKPIRNVFFIMTENYGLVRDLNPGPLAPKARIIPLDQQAVLLSLFTILSMSLHRHKVLTVEPSYCNKYQR